MNMVESSIEMPEAEFKALTSGAKFAWPTAIMMAVCLGLFFSVSYFALDGVIPLWAATLLNGVIVYFLFSVVHDSSHGAILHPTGRHPNYRPERYW
jgi:beta-carotene hydroxylase